MLVLDALPEITFDPRSRRWRYRDTKAFATMDAVRTQAQRYANQEKAALVKVGKALSDGKINLKDFQKQAAVALKHIQLADMIRGLDKQTNLTPEKFLIVARNLKQQYHSGKDPLTGDRFGLKYLAQDIAAGKVSPAQLANRLSMFGESGKLTYWGTKTDTAKSQGVTQARRVLGAAEHCPQCPEYAKKGWVALDELIFPSQACECRSRCRCSLEYR